MKPSLLSQSRARPDIEPVLPLINVVFLLLIFFLMTGKMQQPTDISIVPPEQTREVEPSLVDPQIWLYVNRQGIASYQGQPIDNFAELPQAKSQTALVVCADASLSGAQLNAVLSELAKVSITQIAIVTERVP